MTRSVKAGLLYFFGVFCVGFVLGGVRIMLLMPTLGETLAVLVEVPLMLVLCWILCGRAISLHDVPRRWRERLVMGSTALLCLLFGEFLLAIVFFGQTASQFFASFLLAAGLIGLAGQLLFAAFPLLHMVIDNGSHDDQPGIESSRE